MANEFIIKKGLISKANSVVSGSLIVTDGVSGSFSGSFEGEGSGLTGLISSSYSTTSSYSLTSLSSSYSPSIPPFPFVGDASITGSLTISGSFNAFRLNTTDVILGEGAGALSSLNGPRNVMVGYQAGYTNTTGDDNVAIGYKAGYGLHNNASDGNVFIGKLSGAGSTVGVGSMSNADFNIGIGVQSLLFLTTGDQNIGIGYFAMRNMSSGNNNIALGQTALYTTGTGQYNIGIGYQAGFNQTTGTGNITIGSGSLGVAGESNQLRIGNGESVTVISASLETGNIIFASTASAAYFVGDGSQLTGIETPFGKFGIANSSGSYTYYSDLSSSLQAAVSGDTIQMFTNVTEASDHVYHLKDKVDFNFNGNELFISASATLDAKDMFSDNDIAVSCSFYNGRIRFTQGEGVNIFNRLLYIDNPASEITNIGFEWEAENGSNYTPYYPIRNDGTLNGGKFLGSPNSYLIETFGVLKNLDIYAKMGIYFKGYLKKHYNLRVHSWGGQAGAEASNSYIYDSYFHAETGQALSAFYVINCTIIADAGAGISGTRRLVNSTVLNTGGVGVSLNGEMIGGSVYTTNDKSIEAAASEVLGVTIYNRNYLGPGITIGNGEISNCAIIDDYAYSGQKSIQIDSGATSPTITNCSFDFYNNSTNNTAITAVDDDTPVFFANNTFKNCTPTNPTKVTQAVLNTPDAQGNIVINN
jgi:hypothetical protein